MNGLVIFDIDGTICDTNEVDDRCYTTALSTCLGVSPRQIDWSDAPHITDQAILEWLSRQLLARDLSIEETGEVVRHFVDLLQVESTRNSSAFRPVPGAVEIIERVTGAGWNVAFATGGWRASAELKLQLIGIAANEYVLVTASEATTRQDIVRLAISCAEAQHSRSYQRIVSVGDGTWDVMTAAALELPFVGIGRGARSDQLSRAGARVILADFGDPETFLLALESAPIPLHAHVSV